MQGAVDQSGCYCLSGRTVEFSPTGECRLPDPSAHLLERLELNSMLGLMVLCLFGFFSLFKNWPYNRNGNPLQYSCLENSMDKRRLVGYSPWGGKESDMTERLTLSTS